MSNPHPPFFPMPILRRAALALLFAYLLLPSSHSVHAQTTGALSGRVTNSNGEPIVNAAVRLYRNHDDSSSFSNVATNANGEYSFTGVVSATYQIYFGSPSVQYQDEYYDNQRTIEAAADVHIPAGSTLTGYDAVLDDSGRIVGKTVNSAGEPISGVRVKASYLNEFFYMPTSETTTNENGEFIIYAGEPFQQPQYLFFAPSDPYFSEFYDNKIEVQDAVPFSLGVNEVVTLTVSLERKHTISGTVTDSNAQPLHHIQVYLYTGSWDSTPDLIYTDELGNYQFDLLYHGNYWLNFRDGRMLSEIYNDKSDIDERDAIPLSGDGDVFVADAVLNYKGIISGTVTNIHGVPLDGVVVYTYIEEDDAWVIYGSARTDEFGTYRYYSEIREESDFRLRFDLNGYVQEFYGDAATVESGQSVSLAADTIITNTNVMLRKHSEVEADFNGTPRTGVSSLTTDFVNLAKGDVVTQTWDFGDGMTSTEISPTHTYTQAGVYTVTLTVVGLQNRHTKTASGYISVTDVPIMDLAIELDEQVGSVDAPTMVGETLHFSATAEGTGVQYLWDFGDEAPIVASVATTATGQYVQHAYAAAGTYTVTLTASNSEGEQTMTHEVTVVGAPSEESTLLLPKLQR